MKKAPFPIVSRRRILKVAGVFGAAAMMPLPGRADEEKKLNVYNWDTYIGASTIDSFTGSTEIQVQYDLFASDEEMFAKLKEGNPGYDVVFSGTATLQVMTTLGMLEALDHAKIPNIVNIDEKFRDLPFNPGMKFGLPYMWGSVGIGYRKSKVAETPTSWKAVLDSDQYSGRIALLAEPRLVLGAALKYLGYSMNTTKAEEITAARDVIIKQKPHIKAFAPDEGQAMLLAGDVDIVMEWNGDMIQAAAEDDDLSYIVPTEGTDVWVDSIAIPTGAPHLENAHAFLNHIHDKAVNAEIANTIKYATTNAAALELIAPEDRENPLIYTPDDVVAKSEPIIDVGDIARLYDEAWTAIQAA